MSPDTNHNLAIDEDVDHHRFASSSSTVVNADNDLETVDYVTKNKGMDKTGKINDRSDDGRRRDSIGVTNRNSHPNDTIEEKKSNAPDASSPMLHMPALFWGFSKTTCSVSVDKASKAGYNLHSNSTHHIMYQIQNNKDRCRANNDIDSSKKQSDPNAGVDRFCNVNHCIFTDNGCFGKICPLGVPQTRTKNTASTFSSTDNSKDKLKKEQKLIHAYVGQLIKQFVGPLAIIMMMTAMATKILVMPVW